MTDRERDDDPAAGAAAVVRPCVESDLDALTVAEPAGADVAVRMFARQERGESLYLLALVGRAVVGSGELLIGDEPELRSLHVHEASRGRGIGTALVRAAEECVERPLSLWAGIGNPRARALYERLGYRGSGELRTTTYTYVDQTGEHEATETDERLTQTALR